MGYCVFSARCRGWFFLLLLGVLLGMSAVAQAQPDVIVSCDLLLREKLYARAFRCFVDKARQTLQHRKKLSKLRKIQVGLQIRQAAGAAEQLARQASKLEVKAYWWERAVQVMRLSYQHRLCIRTYRCRQLLGKIAELEQRIGYGRLSIQLPNRTPTRVVLRGYRLTRRSGPQRARWLVKQLRPGTYTIHVTTATGLHRRCPLTLQRRQELSLDCSPRNKVLSRQKHRAIQPPIRPPQRSGLAITGWIVVGVGAAAVITGSVLLILGQNSLQHRDEKAESLRTLGASATAGTLDALAQKANTQLIPEVEALDQMGRNQLISGWILGGVGVAALGTGLVMALMRRTTTPQPPPQPRSRRNSRQEIFYESF